MTDKIDLGYLPTYTDIAIELGHDWHAGSPIRVLEVGVASGGGMDFFAEEFNTQYVYGVDINEDAGRPDQRDRIVTSPQEHQSLYAVLATSGWGPFHLIVDDASHLAGPTAVTLANLWSLVIPGGFYVIEDWNFFEGPGIGVNIWQKVLGHMLAHPSVGDPEAVNPYSGVLPDVESVFIRDGMIVIRKADES